MSLFKIFSNFLSEDTMLSIEVIEYAKFQNIYFEMITVSLHVRIVNVFCLSCDLSSFEHSRVFGCYVMFLGQWGHGTPAQVRRCAYAYGLKNFNQNFELSENEGECEIELLETSACRLANVSVTESGTINYTLAKARKWKDWEGWSHFETNTVTITLHQETLGFLL